MLDHTQPCLILIVGMTRSGKTTFAIRYLLNAGETLPLACVFVFDDEHRVAPRLGLRPCYTGADLEAALARRWVIFNPLRMFPGDRKAAFRFFCDWVFHAARRGPGEKIVAIPEAWRFNTEDSIPFEFARLAQAGREFGVQLLLDTQTPEKLNSSLTGQATELVCFRLLSPEAVRAVARLGADAAHVGRLPLGTFISYNRISGGSLAGRVF